MQYVTRELGSVDLKKVLADDGLLESRPDLAKMIRSGFTSYSVEKDGVTYVLAGGQAAQRSHNGTPEMVTRDLETHNFRRTPPGPVPAAQPTRATPPALYVPPVTAKRYDAITGGVAFGPTAREERVARQQAADARARSMPPTRVTPPAPAAPPASRVPPSMAKRFAAVLDARRK